MVVKVTWGREDEEQSEDRRKNRQNFLMLRECPPFLRAEGC